jgi:hypothetical protein
VNYLFSSILVGLYIMKYDLKRSVKYFILN